MEALNKIKTTLLSSPLGAVAGVCGGFLVAKKLGYHRTITVIPFMVVGLIIGSTVGSAFRGKVAVSQNKAFITK